MKRTELKRGYIVKLKRTPIKAKARKTTPARQAANGRDCQIRVPEYCEAGNETVVLCHYRMNDGGGQKPDDEQGAWGCATCHAIVDGKKKTPEFTYTDKRLMHAEGVFRTQKILRDERIYFIQEKGGLPVRIG